MAKPNTQSILKEIISGEIENVYINITNKAIEWAVAGFIGEANNLLEQLWKFNIPHPADLWLPDQGLQVLWTVSGKQPANIPFSFNDISEIVKDNWYWCFFISGDEANRAKLQHKPFSELKGREFYLKAIDAASKMSERPQDILQALRIFLTTENAIGYSFFHATTCGALLAARYNLKEDTEYFIQQWGEGYATYWSNYILPYLMRNRHTAAVLSTGLLAPLSGLSTKICEEETKQLIEALTQRMAGGRTLVYKDLSWQQLLDQTSQLAIGKNTLDFSDEILQNNTLCRPPAKAIEIQSIEKRLKVKLPDDYKEFLATSNGFECFSNIGVELCAAAEVDHLVNVDQGLVDIWSNSMDSIDNSIGEKLRSSIIIGGLQAEQQLLLIPLKNKQWECWFFASWQPGETVYPGFRFYMEEELQRLESDFYDD